MTVLCVLSRFRDDYHPSLCLLFVLIHTSFLDIYTDWSQTYCSARSLIPHPLPFPLCMSLLLLLLFDTMKKKIDIFIFPTPPTNSTSAPCAFSIHLALAKPCS